MLLKGIVLLTCQVVATIGRPSLRNTEVCGTDGFTYADVYELDLAQTKNADLELLYYGPCDFLDKTLRVDIRTVIYCGSDNKTYDSYLNLLVEKSKKPELVIKHLGPCEDLTLLRTVDTSVCATDFSSYDTIEEFKFAQIVYPDLRILHSGYCILPILYKSGHMRCVDCLFDGFGLSGARSDLSEGGEGGEGSVNEGESGGEKGLDGISDALNEALSEGNAALFGGNDGQSEGNLPQIGGNDGTGGGNAALNGGNDFQSGGNEPQIGGDDGTGGGNGGQSAVDGGKDGKDSKNLAQNLEQIAHGVFNVVGGSVGLLGLGLGYLTQKQQQKQQQQQWPFRSSPYLRHT